MPDYGQNNSNLFNGHTAIPTNPRTSLDDIADTRDALSAIVGSGNGGMKPDDQKAVYGRLTALLGKDTANKMINQALIYNQRPDVQGKTAQQRIAQFYDIGSRDPELNTIMGKAKTFDQGVQSGNNTSVNTVNQKLAAGQTAYPSVAVTENNNIGQIQQASGGF